MPPDNKDKALLAKSASYKSKHTESNHQNMKRFWTHKKQMFGLFNTYKNVKI